MRALTHELGGGDYCFAPEFSSKTARVESFSYDGTDCGALLPRDPKADEDYSTVANVYWNPNFRPSRLRDTPVPDFDDLPLIVQDVPEPASLALALAALAAAFAARGSVARRARADLSSAWRWRRAVQAPSASVAFSASSMLQA
ncbi:MAG: PEP-CTERM sorting domain-containing protein [Betaproteobacteria bacterium]|nr:PEP-CTERM sorting domain-containing protein [Betaproteobacteria bacterium]